MQHTNTSSTSGGSTTSLFYRDLGARWLTTRSTKGIRRSNKNRLTLSNSPIYGWWRPAWNLSFEARVGIVAGEARARGRARAGGLERTVGQLHLPSVAKIARTASASACAARRAGSTSASDARRAAFTSVPVLTGAARAAAPHSSPHVR